MNKGWRPSKFYNLPSGEKEIMRVFVREEIEINRKIMEK